MAKMSENDHEPDSQARSQFSDTELGRALIARDNGAPLSDEQIELLQVFDESNTPQAK